MDPETFVGTSVGFILAIVFLTHLLVKYENFLNDRKLYIGSGMGFISAIIAYLVEQLGIFSLNPQNIEEEAGLAFISIFGIAILHTALKGMLLNHKVLREGKDRNIAFYGAAFGYIFGAIYVTVFISKSLKGGNVDTFTEVILVFLFALGMILFQGSTGVIMGSGIADFRVFTAFRNVSALHIFMNFFIFLSGVNLIPSYLMVALVLSWGAFLYVFVYKEVLPDSLTKDQKTKLFGTGKPSGKRLSGK